MKNEKYQKICHFENKKLFNSNLSFQTFGNISIRIDKNNFVIKPSGTNSQLTNFLQYPIINIFKKKKVNKTKLKQSVDTNFHLQIYKNFPTIKSVCHTHSKYATIWAQSLKKIPNFGTTHSDYWLDDIEITRRLKNSEIKINDYEKNIGKTIIEKLKKKFSKGLLIANHGPITIGENFEESFLNAQRLEFIAELAYKSLKLNTNIKISKKLKEFHFERKNGRNRYYGQSSNLKI